MIKTETTFNVNKVKGLMAEKNETMGDLAEILNIHRNTVNIKLNGIRDFTVSELTKIANHYNVDVNVFFKK